MQQSIFPQTNQMNPYNQSLNQAMLNNYNRYNSIPQITPPMQNGIIWVQGIEGGKAFQMPPNSNALLMDSENEGIFYIKTSDNVGMCNLRVFSYKEITGTANTNTTALPDLSNYVTKEELKATIDEMLKGDSLNGKQSVSVVSRNTKKSANE